MESKDVIQMLENYRKSKALIGEYRLRLEELESDIGLTALEIQERTGATNKVSSDTENQAIRLIEEKEKLYKLIQEKDIELRRIENCMSVLNEAEREVIEMIYFKRLNYGAISYRIDRSITRIYQIRAFAIEKMLEVLNQ